MNYWKVYCAVLITALAGLALVDAAPSSGETAAKQEKAEQLWAAKAPAKDAAVKAYPCRIVSYADDMARHDCGDYC